MYLEITSGRWKRKAAWEATVLSGPGLLPTGQCNQAVDSANLLVLTPYNDGKVCESQWGH